MHIYVFRHHGLNQTLVAYLWISSEKKQSKAIESQDAVYSIEKSQEFGHTAEKVQILPNFNGKNYSCSVSANVQWGINAKNRLWKRRFVVGAIYWSLDSNGQTHAFVPKRTLKKNTVSTCFITSFFIISCYEIGWQWWQPAMSPHAKKRANRVPLCKFRRVIQPDGCWSRPRMRSSSFTISKMFTFVNFSKSSTTCRTFVKLLQQWTWENQRDDCTSRHQRKNQNNIKLPQKIDDMSISIMTFASNRACIVCASAKHFSKKQCFLHSPWQGLVKLPGKS